jgi:hypothetical protein
LLLLLAIGQWARAQFVPALLENRSYWGDGKSEIDFYDAEFVRGEQHFRTELLVVLTPAFVDPLTLTPLEQKRATKSQPVIRMKQASTIPRGLLLEQRSLDLLWKMGENSLARLSFAGTDGFGNISRLVMLKVAAPGSMWQLTEDSYRGTIQPQQIAPASGALIFYDELPLRVRTIDFSKPKGEFDIQLVPTITDLASTNFQPKPAKMAFQTGKRQIDVELKHEQGTDHFALDGDFPFLLREWKMSSGETWKMKNSLRAEYQKYDKAGDRERAFKDPMLRHPD